MCHLPILAQSVPLFASLNMHKKAVKSKLHVDFHTNEPTATIWYHKRDFFVS